LAAKHRNLLHDEWLYSGSSTTCDCCAQRASWQLGIATAPITDAAALDLTQRRGSDYARVRAFGSIGFVVGILLAGWIFDSFGMHWFLWLLLSVAVLRVIASIALPRFKTQETDTNSSSESVETLTHRHTSDYALNQTNSLWVQGFVSGMAPFKKPGILSVIIGAALINASHSFQNIYSVLHWAELGISTTWASWLWTIGVVAEVALMWKFKSLAKKVSARQCLLFSCATCVIRWFFTGLNPGLGALPQSVLTTLTTLLMALGVWLSGHFYQSLGGYSYWAMAVLAMIGGGLILNSYRSTLQDT